MTPGTRVVVVGTRDRVVGQDSEYTHYRDCSPEARRLGTIISGPHEHSAEPMWLVQLDDEPAGVRRFWGESQIAFAPEYPSDRFVTLIESREALKATGFNVHSEDYARALAAFESEPDDSPRPLNIPRPLLKLVGDAFPTQTRWKCPDRACPDRAPLKSPTRPTCYTCGKPMLNPIEFTGAP